MKKSIEQIRKEMIGEIDVAFNSSSSAFETNLSIHQEVLQILQQYNDIFVQRAVKAFNAEIEDQLRYLKLGEAADKFIQAMKLPPVEVKV